MAKDTDIAWLAGAIEADGSVGMGFHKTKLKSREGFAVGPAITFTNQDALLIEAVEAIMFYVCGKRPQLRAVNTNYENGRYSMALTMRGQPAVLALLLALVPYMRGEKGAKARLLISFINSRQSKKRVRGHTPYDRSELGIIVDFYDRVQRKGGKRNLAVRQIIQQQVEKEDAC
jgi:hypothetical protein